MERITDLIHIDCRYCNYEVKICISTGEICEKAHISFKSRLASTQHFKLLQEKLGDYLEITKSNENIEIKCKYPTLYLIEFSVTPPHLSPYICIVVNK
jgi:hypothetical protein